MIKCPSDDYVLHDGIRIDGLHIKHEHGKTEKERNQSKIDFASWVWEQDSKFSISKLKVFRAWNNQRGDFAYKLKI